MSSDSEASSTVVATSGGNAQSSNSRCIASLKYLLLFVAVASPYASAFLVYPLPTVSDWLYVLSWICWVFIFFVSLGILWLRRWIAVAIFAAAWIWLFFGPSHGPGESFYWFLQQGFRFHAWPVKDYLSKCKLVEFVENGAKQTVGSCEASGVMSPIDYVVYYDTTGQFPLPLSQRTPEWKQAMSRIDSEEFLEFRGRRLFGNFYRVGIPLSSFRGG